MGISEWFGGELLGAGKMSESIFSPKWPGANILFFFRPKWKKKELDQLTSTQPPISPPPALSFPLGPHDSMVARDDHNVPLF